ncbi:MAG: PSD1 domain-containing protein [Pirellulales bacterium]|nr:PSD1 domain-containing protein [Pirellulales bacterium]
MPRVFIASIALVALLSLLRADEIDSLPAAESKAQAGKPVDFAHQIAPLLKAHCGKCHIGRMQEGDFSMNTRASLLKSKAVAPGKSGESVLIARVTSKDPDEQMPPEGERLRPEEVELLRRWIDAGAAYDEGFTFASQHSTSLPLALTKPAVPPPSNDHAHPIDRIVEANFAENNVSFPPPVDDATFARRVYLDLIGLLPKPAELQAFLADQSPDKRDRLIDELLSRDVDYADHWFTFWCDLLRNDFTGTGYIDGGRKQITSWLYDALRKNMPYNQFVRELIAPSPESEGFIKGIKWRGNVNASQVTEMQFSQNVAQVFLGINLKCASCHDSFINEWKLADAYNLAAVTADRPMELTRCDVPQGKTATPAFLFGELGGIDAGKPRAERLEQLAGLITDPRNGRLPRTMVNRLWHRLMGRGIVHPVDAMDGDPWSVDLLEYLAGELVTDKYDMKQLLRQIAKSQIYQAKCVPPPDPNRSEGPVFRGPIARRMTAEQFIDAVWQITGTTPSKAAASFSGRGTTPVRSSLVASDLLMRSLGRPNRDQVVTTRPEDLSMLEALDLTNGQMMADYLAKGVTHLQDENPSRSADETVDALYVAALGRHPNQDELATGREITGNPMTDDGLADLMWCIFVLPEFQLVK